MKENENSGLALIKYSLQGARLPLKCDVSSKDRDQNKHKNIHQPDESNHLVGELNAFLFLCANDWEIRTLLNFLKECRLRFY